MRPYTGAGMMSAQEQHGVAAERGGVPLLTPGRRRVGGDDEVPARRKPLDEEAAGGSGGPQGYRSPRREVHEVRTAGGIGQAVAAGGAGVRGKHPLEGQARGKRQ